MSTDIQKYQEEVTKELANKETFNLLVATTFKGLTEENVRQAIVEGMIRQFTFKDFLEKNVYAIPFNNKTTGKQEYSLITSIDFMRKRGMKSGVIGVSLPAYEETKEGKIISCSISVKRKINATDTGEFFAKVYFDEYTTKQNQWTSKPRTMIAKVAEAHALRKACPEEMSQMFTAEEMGEKAAPAKPAGAIAPPAAAPDDTSAFEAKLKACTNLDDLKKEFIALPPAVKVKLTPLKDQIKATLTNNAKS